MSKILSALALFTLILPSAVEAQIVPDSTLGAENSIVDRDRNRDTINGGAIRNTNLFHSFQEFSVGIGREAFFSNPNSIVNIFSRVTGNNISNIQGVLGVLGDANLFLINPNGIIFGANARLDLNGSFVGATADSILFDNFEFSASNPQSVPLITINMPIGLGFRENPGDINIDRTIEVNNTNAEEIGDTGQLLDTAQEINNSNSALPQTISGELTGSSDADLYQISLPQGSTFSATTTAPDAELFLFDSNGLGITADFNILANLETSLSPTTINSTGVYYVGISSFLNTPLSQDGAIFDFFSGEATGIGSQSPLNNWDDFGFGSGSYEIELTNTITANGNLAVKPGKTLALIGGNVNLNNGQINSPGSNVYLGSVKQAGIVDIDNNFMPNISQDLRQGSVSIVNDSSINVRGNGNGSITIEAQNLEIDFSGLRAGIAENSGSLETISGDIKLNIQEQTSLRGESVIANSISENSQGNIGNIEIKTNSLALAEDSQINILNFFGQGNIGDINIQAESISIGEDGIDGDFSRISNQTGGTGSTGNINIDTNILTINNQSQLDIRTFNQGDTGDINIDTNTIIVDESFIINSIVEGAEGNGGTVNINADNFELIDSQIVLDSEGIGDAANINIDANIIILNDSQIFASIKETGIGKGGNIDINGDVVNLNNSQIFATINELGMGNAGDINITATEINVNTSLFDTQTNSIGNSGDINLDADIANLNDSQVFTSINETGIGKAGDININGGIVNLNNSILETEVKSKGIGNAGEIIIEVDSLLADNNSFISTISRGEGDGEKIEINAKDEIILDNRTSILTGVSSEGKGNSGDINLETNFLEINNEALISSTNNSPEGNSGDINIIAQESIVLNGTVFNVENITLTGIQNNKGRLNQGNTGKINIETGSLSLSNAVISSDIRGIGESGGITITVEDNVNLDDFSAISSSLLSFAEGTAGDIVINAKALELNNISSISTTAFADSIGNAGKINLTIGETITLDNESGIFSDVFSDAEGIGGDINIITHLLSLDNFSSIDARINGIGKAGSIFIDTESLSVTDAAKITSQTNGEGDAGKIEINAINKVEVSGEISTQVGQPNTDVVARGNGNLLSINTRELIVREDGVISSSTSGIGNAGDIEIINTEIVDISNNSLITTQVNSNAIGNGGEIFIDTGRLNLLEGGVISVATSGNGEAGTVNINASESVTISSTNTTAPSSIVATTSSNKPGGDININTPNLSISTHNKLEEKAFISSSTSQEGKAGDINLNIAEKLELNNAAISANTTNNSTGNGGDIKVKTQSATLTNNSVIGVNSLGTGNAGNVDFTTENLTLENNSLISAETNGGEGGNLTFNLIGNLILDNSAITTEAGGTGNGGNIITKAEFIILKNSDIIANAFEGDGGRIDLTIQGLFTSLDSNISASSQFGLDGIIAINNPEVDPSQGIVELPQTVVDPNQLIAENACKQGSDSQFYLTGRGGLPPKPNSNLDTNTVSVDLIQPVTTNITSPQLINQNSESNNQNIITSKSIIPARDWIENEQGEIVLVHYDPNNKDHQRNRESLGNCNRK